MRSLQIAAVCASRGLFGGNFRNILPHRELSDQRRLVDRPSGGATGGAGGDLGKIGAVWRAARLRAAQMAAEGGRSKTFWIW